MSTYIQVGEKIAKEFNDAVPAYPGLVTAMTLDLADLDSVRAFAKKFGEEREKLHVLINNAGIMHTPEGKTKQGTSIYMAGNNRRGAHSYTGSTPHSA
jgi:short-subunit dehydrogenase involved in D-alanine esterification of teichoic acids